MSKGLFHDRFQVAADLPKDTYVSSGIFGLDINTKGGFKENKIHLLYGTRGSGKTTTAYNAAAQAQKKYPTSKVYLLDLENSFDPFYATKLGLDLQRVVVPKSEDISEAHFESYIAGINDILNGDILDPETGEPIHISMIILDSLAATMVEKEINAADQVSRGGQYRAKSSRILFNLFMAYARTTRSRSLPSTFIVITHASEEKTFTGAISYKPTGGLPVQFAATNIIRFKGTETSVAKTLSPVKSMFSKEDLTNPQDKLVTEISFYFNKNRGDGEMEALTYLPHISSEKSGIKQHVLINAPIIFNAAKRYNVVKKYKDGYAYSVDPDTFYKTQDIAKAALFTDKDLENKVAIECLKQSRLESEMDILPGDGYLYGEFLVPENDQKEVYIE